MIKERGSLPLYVAFSAVGGLLKSLSAFYMAGKSSSAEWIAWNLGITLIVYVSYAGLGQVSVLNQIGSKLFLNSKNEELSKILSSWIVWMAVSVFVCSMLLSSRNVDLRVSSSEYIALILLFLATQISSLSSTILRITNKFFILGMLNLFSGVIVFIPSMLKSRISLVEFAYLNSISLFVLLIPALIFLRGNRLFFAFKLDKSYFNLYIIPGLKLNLSAILFSVLFTMDRWYVQPGSILQDYYFRLLIISNAAVSIIQIISQFYYPRILNKQDRLKISIKQSSITVTFCLSLTVILFITASDINRNLLKLDGFKQEYILLPMLMPILYSLGMGSANYLIALNKLNLYNGVQALSICLAATMLFAFKNAINNSIAGIYVVISFITAVYSLLIIFSHFIIVKKADKT